MGVSRETAGPRPIERDEFYRRVLSTSPEALPPHTLAALYGHYELLLKWNERLSLVGPGTVAGAPEIHYGEALAALPLIPATSRGILVDLGTGGGFPGFVLAAARPSLRPVLVESRERKWAFLQSAVRATGVAAECLLGTVDRDLPAGFPRRVDWLTLRALKLPHRAWQALLPRFAQEARVLLWAGAEDPSVPGDRLRRVRAVPLPGTRSKRILELAKGGSGSS